MKFEVLNREGKDMMWTESPACITDEETKRSMRRAGYRFRQVGEVNADGADRE